MRRNMSVKRKTMGRIERDRERQRALDHVEGRDAGGSAPAMDGELTDSIMDLATIFENVMLGQTRGGGD